MGSIRFVLIDDENNDRCNAYFAKEDCQSRPYMKGCNPRFGKVQAYALRESSWKAVDRARQLRYMKTGGFRELAHFRNGIEAVPSLLRSRYHVDKIPAHGKKQTCLYFGFKIGALNFQKLLDYCNSIEKCASKSEAA